MSNAETKYFHFWGLLKKYNKEKLGVMAHNFYSGTKEAEVGGSLWILG